MAITARDDYLAAYQKRLAADFAAPLERGKDPAPVDSRLRLEALQLAVNRPLSDTPEGIVRAAEMYLDFLCPKGDN